MVNATNPTSVSLSLLNGLIKFPCDSIASLRLINCNFSEVLSGVSTNYNGFTNTLGTTYSVPASTNLRIYGFDASQYTIQGTVDLLQFGYGDNVTGTNFVTLFDIGASFGLTVATFTNNNFLLGGVTIPATKFPLIKNHHNNVNTAVAMAMKIYSLETN
jgi:hypothetical protein